MLRERFKRERVTYRVTAFVGPLGHILPNFKGCTVVMVTPTDPKKGPSIPESRQMFKADTKLGDTYTEVTERFFHEKEE